MKKRIIALAAIMAVSVMLTACTSADDVNSVLGGGNTTTAAQQGNNGDANTTEAEKEAPSKFTHGTVSDDSYSSDLFGIEAEFDDSWTVYSDEDLADQNSISDMSDESINKVLDKTATAYEFMAAIESGSNVNIVIENLNLTNKGKTIEADKYIDMALPNLKSGLESVYESVTVNKDSVEICGKTLPCIKAEISQNGMSAKEVQIPVVSGTYVAIITFTALDDNDLSTLMSAFKSVG